MMEMIPFYFKMPLASGGEGGGAFPHICFLKPEIMYL